MTISMITEDTPLPAGELEFSRSIYLHHITSLLIITLFTCVAIRNFISALTILFNRPAPAMSHWLCCAHTFVALMGCLISLLRKIFPFVLSCSFQTTMLMSLAVLGEPAIIAVLASKAYYSRKRPPILCVLGILASLTSATFVFLGLWGTHVHIDTPWVCNISHATWWFLVKCLCVDLPINLLFSSCFLLVMWRQAMVHQGSYFSIYVSLGRDGLAYMVLVSIMGLLSVLLSLVFKPWAPHVYGMHFILSSTLLVLQMERGAKRRPTPRRPLSTGKWPPPFPSPRAQTPTTPIFPHSTPSDMVCTLASDPSQPHRRRPFPPTSTTLCNDTSSEEDEDNDPFPFISMPCRKRSVTSIPTSEISGARVADPSHTGGYGEGGGDGESMTPLHRYPSSQIISRIALLSRGLRERSQSAIEAKSPVPCAPSSTHHSHSYPFSFSSSFSSCSFPSPFSSFSSSPTSTSPIPPLPPFDPPAS
ncbi:MAG: hypothetical protein DHS80DRAFT_24035 [Piptocephalis tieghemiana]|nr:MAG: hypothetical protein DHS80DRAFT_24035 [Piptocephalis tieghemiana]